MPQSWPVIAFMRLGFALFALMGFGCGVAAAEEVPLPRPRPQVPVWIEPRSFAQANAGAIDPAQMSAEPTPCDTRLAAVAAFEPMPRLIGPGACGGPDMVRLDAILLGGDTRIDIKPPATLRCPMAEALASWVREDAAPRLAELGSALRSLENYDDFECRGRNRVVGGKLSEHGKGDALDVRAFALADGRRIEPTDVHAPKELREALRESACRRFTTVLGPGSDGYHEAHVHLDLAERKQGYRICEWDVREPLPVAAPIPLPQPRPAELAAMTARKP